MERAHSGEINVVKLDLREIGLEGTDYNDMAEDCDNSV
jgi:hypothetical protein